jgi:hypothetical protein
MRKKKEDANSSPVDRAEDLKSITVENVVRERIGADKFASIYANDLQLQTTPWDFRMIFGLVTEAPTEKSPTMLVSTIGELRISPQLAKRLWLILGYQLEHYEKNIAPIELSPEKSKI